MLMLLNILYGLFRFIRAIVFIGLILFGIVIFGELVHCNGGSSTSDNAVHWRP